MLYEKSQEKFLSAGLFKNPTSEYRGAPFWAWNCKLDRDLLLREIEYMKAMGLGGFHIHSRTGMATEYLGDEFMELVKACNEKAKKEEMLCWLYDEDRWPSGFAGGLVTKDIRWRARRLVFTPHPFNEGFFAGKAEFDAAVEKAESPEDKDKIKGYLLARYEVVLENGFLKEYKRLKDGEQPGEGAKAWWAYLELQPANSWYNNQTYLNTLDPEAVKKFVEVTYDRYYSVVGEDFGKSIPAIFTDEPNFGVYQSLRFAEDETPVRIPFTDDFDSTYHQTYGDHILDFLPELFWELPDGRVSVARYRYRDHLSERFASAFADTIGKWCEEHGIMFTGHLLDEETLESQTEAVGEAMRSYRSFQLPGIDILCDKREFSTAKQAQSAAHQYDRPGVLSELYGVTNWDFDFKGHKLQGDWQAALGVTARVHHLTWVSMAGEAKRDYPACIGYQSPWYREYPLVENHFARINTALTRGKPHVRVAVIHPIESYWLYYGPYEHTSTVREELESNFNNVINWLLFGLVDFDFVSEALLPDLCPEDVSAPFKVGAMEYDAVVVPGCHTLRSTTLKRLESFAKAGGCVVFAGKPAWLVDAVPSDRAEKLASECVSIPFSKNELLKALDKFREVDVRLENGSRADNLLYQMRRDGDGRWLFLCHGFDRKSNGYSLKEKFTIRIKGIWNPELYDTMTGEIRPCPAQVRGNETWIEHDGAIHDSILLYLKPGMPAVVNSESGKNSTGRTAPSKTVEIADPVEIILSEPNVLLLDMAEYSFDGGEWQPEEEILRIDNLFREKLGYPSRTGSIAQPWTYEKDEVFPHRLYLKFVFHSEIPIKSAQLALENAETTEIKVNGQTVQPEITGWFVDESIKTVMLPDMPEGKNEIILGIPFNSQTNVEWCYLLGDFGVRVDGRHKRIISPVRTLAFGDWTTQGLPFYAGNVTYRCKITSNGEFMTLQATQFSNPLLSVSLDGKVAGKIAFAPYELDLGFVEKGEHILEITAFGNRINAFGCVHNCNDAERWFGPGGWRTTGEHWCYQYRLKRMGLLISPRLLCR